MYLNQIYTDSLSESDYFFSSDGEAFIIDPLGEIDEYFNLAKNHKVKIKYIFETHLNADFVSSRLNLSEQTGAPIINGFKTEVNFPFHFAGIMP